MCLSIYPSIYRSIYQSIHLSINQSTYVFMYLSIYSSGVASKMVPSFHVLNWTCEGELECGILDIGTDDTVSPQVAGSMTAALASACERGQQWAQVCSRNVTKCTVMV